jgi:hypothetical protein
MFAMGSNTVIEHNYWHDSWNHPGGHGDGIEHNGGYHQHAHHNVIIGEFETGAVVWGDYYRQIYDILFEHNYVGGDPGILVGLGGNDGHGGTDNWRFRYNRLACSHTTVMSVWSIENCDDLTWTGNVCAATPTVIYDNPLTQWTGAGWVKACANGEDDDGDGLTDLNDTGCANASDNLE